MEEAFTCQPRNRGTCSDSIFKRKAATGYERRITAIAID